MLIPGKTPLMILSNATLFPGAILPLHIFEPRYRRMLSDVLESHRMFAIAMRRPGTRREVPMPVAWLGVVRVCVGVPDGTSNLLRNPLERQVVLEALTGIKRAGADLILTYHAKDAARWLAEAA